MEPTAALGVRLKLAKLAALGAPVAVAGTPVCAKSTAMPWPAGTDLTTVSLAFLVLVKVQATVAALAMAAASSVTLRAARSGVKVPPVPMPVQLMSVTV